MSTVLQAPPELVSDAVNRMMSDEIRDLCGGWPATVPAEDLPHPHGRAAHPFTVAGRASGVRTGPIIVALDDDGARWSSCRTNGCQ